MQKTVAPKSTRSAVKAAKRDAKKREIANSAIEALTVHGYARTTLRDIAAQSDLSLGMLHYYFESKEDLLIYCVRKYKEDFVQNLEAATQGISAPEDLKRVFCTALVDTILTEAATHRLWYDIRSQAMFDETFVPVVREIEDMLQLVLTTFATHPEDRLEVGGLYARVDGVFRFLLQDRLSERAFGRPAMVGMFEEALK